MTRAADGVRQVVLELIERVTDSVIYAQPDDDSSRRPRLELSWREYERLGEPERITVTIRGGAEAEPVSPDYLAGLEFAAEMVHAEARWQTERAGRGYPSDRDAATHAAERMAEVEKALRTVMKTIQPQEKP